MATDKRNRRELLAENEELRLRLEEAEETLRAIQSGEVDALVVSGPEGDRVFSLQGAEVPYRVLAESMNEGAANLAADGTVLYCNGCLAAMLKVPLERLIGTKLGDYVAAADQSLFADRLEMSPERSGKAEISMIDADGNPFPVLLSCCAMELPGAMGIGAVLTDIRARKEAEARLREAQLQALHQNSILNGINRIFYDTLSCESEDALCRRCLETAEQLTGSRFGIIAELNTAGRLDTIALSDPGWSACRMPKTNAVVSLRDMEVRGILGNVVKAGRATIINDPATFPERAGTPEGHPELTSFLGTPLRQAGETIGLIGLANKEGGYSSADGEALEALAAAVVEALMRRRAEDMIRKLNADLEQRVLERTVQLEAAKEELEAFTYSVSHDLRAPLRGITGFSKVLREDCRDSLSAEGQDSLERIISAAGRMDRLIDDLLEFSSMQRAEMRRGRVDLSEIARSIARSLKEAQPERQVEFIIADDLVAEGDERLLAVVMENLLNNAWKFTGKVSHAVIVVGMVPNNGKKVFFVRDNGAGFDMTYAEKMFKPFQRLHSADEFPGTGIGLATVRRIVSRHGGQIWGEGKKDEGATFYFTIPVGNAPFPD